MTHRGEGGGGGGGRGHRGPRSRCDSGLNVAIQHSEEGWGIVEMGKRLINYVLS